jgi:hypothetical protein
MGQKVQAATGQQYGAVKAQEEAQKLVALPQMDAVVPAPGPRPGEMPLMRRSERPAEPVTASAEPMGMQKMVDPQRRQRVLAALPLLEQAASQPGASPEMMNTVRKMKNFVGNVSELHDGAV